MLSMKLCPNAAPRGCFSDKKYQAMREASSMRSRSLYSMKLYQTRRANSGGGGETRARGGPGGPATRSKSARHSAATRNRVETAMLLRRASGRLKGQVLPRRHHARPEAAVVLLRQLSGAQDCTRTPGSTLHLREEINSRVSLGLLLYFAMPFLLSPLPFHRLLRVTVEVSGR